MKICNFTFSVHLFIYLFIYLFICSSFNNSFTSTDYVALDYRITIN